MTPVEALERLLQALPEFVQDYENSDGRPTEPGDDLLLHVVTADLARFYMREGRHNPELAKRFWAVVEQLAESGDQAVENAVHVSLVEWFEWGSEEERGAISEAESLQGSATRAMRAYYH